MDWLTVKTTNATCGNHVGGWWWVAGLWILDYGLEMIHPKNSEPKVKIENIQTFKVLNIFNF